MNENIDLTKILEGCEDRKLWSPTYGTLWLRCVNKYYKDYPIIVINCLGKVYAFNKKGIGEYGEQLFPSKYQHDWNKFNNPIDLDIPVMCSDNKLDWTLCYYKYYDNKKNIHIVRGYFLDNTILYNFKYIIRFEDFNPNDIEDSIKNYNIQK